ncbi:SlyX family protein [Frischella sp. Ac48]|uniref:Protein SlyX homolog n=1 Tax=Frischella japonica TaxID=2741544 RepID=A0ABR7QUC3_9GAMM|nr:MULTISPECIES: SlyX family protein [Frischella]MBC9129808.1 SlyX family protein [Frischella japonica]MBX4132798.1 SlyX family protein [Frischella sp. Ac48]
MKNRIEELETKVSFQDITIEELNQIVIQLQSEVTKLKEQLKLLSKKLQATHQSNIASLTEETPPPHY